MYYTSIEQSKKLLELGLSPETADMYYALMEDNIPTKYPMLIDCDCADYYKGEDIPCWSVGALLELMPKAIQKYDERERCYKTYHPNLYQAYYHCCGYAFGPSLNQENHDMLCTFGDGTWIDVIYKQVVWLLENNHIKND